MPDADREDRWLGAKFCRLGVSSHCRLTPSLETTANDGVLEHERGVDMLRFVAVVCAATLGFSSACSPSAKSSPDAALCQALAVEYQAAMRAAVLCDPGSSDECTSGRPIVVSVQNPDGSLTVEGLCLPPCYGAVNVARAGPVDAVLAHYRSEGCAARTCWCPPTGQPPHCLDSGTCSGLLPLSCVDSGTCSAAVFDPRQ